jgi:hypothetical protein
MLKRLKKLFERDATTRPMPEVIETLSDTQILEEYFSPTQAAKEALKTFALLISSYLGTAESERLTDRVMSCLQPGKSTDEALLEGLVDEHGQQHGKWLLINTDFRATDEIEWQANEVLQAHGVAESWHLDGTDEMTPLQALGAFSTWVRPYGMELLHLEAGDTDWCAFLVKASDARQVLQLAEKAGLKVQYSEDFLADNL